VSFKYARDHAVTDCRVITFPTVPTAVNVVTVWIVKAVKLTVLQASILKSLNVLFHPIVTIPVLHVAFQKLL
jgi:hypothetical protein